MGENIYAYLHNDDAPDRCSAPPSILRPVHNAPVQSFSSSTKPGYSVNPVVASAKPKPNAAAKSTVRVDVKSKIFVIHLAVLFYGFGF